jgi:hypothetical protein
MCRTIGGSQSLITRPCRPRRRRLRPPDIVHPGRNHHYRVIQSLELTLGKDAKFIRAFDAFRKKRNISSYDIGGGISHREVEEMIGIAQSLQQDVEQWIRTNHASLL